MDAQDTQAFSAIVTAVATIVLAVITWSYARHTRVMSEAMARQIQSDIQIFGASIELIPSTGLIRDGYLVYCMFGAWVRNRNSASGSIAQPTVFAILDDGTELQAGFGQDSQVLFLRGGDLLAANIRYEFFFHHTDPDRMGKTTRLLSPTTRFRISCMDNLGNDRGKDVLLTPIRRGEG